MAGNSLPFFIFTLIFSILITYTLKLIFLWLKRRVTFMYISISIYYKRYKCMEKSDIITINKFSVYFAKPYLFSLIKCLMLRRMIWFEAV